MRVTPEQNLSILITTSSGEDYVLPYGHFLSGALLKKVDTTETFLELTFAVHTVLLEGARLRYILKHIHGFRVASLRPSTSEQDDQPHIKQIQILSRQEE